MELERKIEDLKTELLVKDETMKKYVSRLQCFYEKLKEHTKQSNQVNTCPMIASDQDCEVSTNIFDNCKYLFLFQLL